MAFKMLKPLLVILAPTFYRDASEPRGLELSGSEKLRAIKIPFAWQSFTLIELDLT